MEIVKGNCNLVGPLGQASEVKDYGTVVVIGGGVGAAIAYPTAKAMHEAGNHVSAILGGRSRDLILLEPEIRAISDEVFIKVDVEALLETELQRALQK